MSAEARASWNLPETFTFESQAVRYGSLGEVDSPAIVLLHGTPFCRLTLLARLSAPCLGMTCGCISNRGLVQPGRRPSIGRSPRWISDIQTRSSHGMPKFTAQSGFSGARKTAGSLLSGGVT